MMKTLLFILLLIVAGCAHSATAYYDYLQNACLAGVISYEEYQRQLTPELLKAVAKEADWPFGPGGYYPPPVFMPTPYLYGSPYVR